MAERRGHRRFRLWRNFARYAGRGRPGVRARRRQSSEFGLGHPAPGRAGPASSHYRTRHNSLPSYGTSSLLLMRVHPPRRSRATLWSSPSILPLVRREDRELHFRVVEDAIPLATGATAAPTFHATIPDRPLNRPGRQRQSLHYRAGVSYRPVPWWDKKEASAHRA